jgi:hypothetical protein
MIAADAGAELELEVRGGSLPSVGDQVSVAVDVARINVLRDESSR